MRVCVERGDLSTIMIRGGHCREVLFQFLKKQWHEEATEDQLAHLQALVMRHLELSHLPSQVCPMGVLGYLTVALPALVKC